MKTSSIFFFISIFLLFIIALMTSCDDLIEVSKPRTQLIRTAVFEDDLTAVAAISGLYTRVSSQTGGFSSITYLASLSADELTVEQGDPPLQFFRNEIFSDNAAVFTIWQESFRQIALANAIIEGLEKSEKVTSDLKKQLMGEAKFFRAFHHFYLVNLYGEVPYITTTDYRVNAVISRMSTELVYEKIIDDLLDAKSLLSEDYSWSKNERVRVNKWVAASLLARVYLYREDWVHAEEQSTTVIGNNSLYSLLDSGKLNKVFLKNSLEAIWQVLPPSPQKYTTEGSIFNRPSYSPDVATLSDDLYNTFEPDDDRRDEWIGERTAGGNTWLYPLKYKETYNDTLGPDEYSTIFRLAEQYLIRAEARAKQGKLIGAGSAESDLNIIRDRAGLPSTTAVSEAGLLTAIEHERRVELFTEWGHRWLDLKRTGRVAAVLSPLKTEWEDTDSLYPVPYEELQLNPYMTQNPGY